MNSNTPDDHKKFLSYKLEMLKKWQNHLQSGECHRNFLIQHFEPATKFNHNLAYCCNSCDNRLSDRGKYTVVLLTKI